MASDFLNLVKNRLRLGTGGGDRVAVVGMAKNTGKTVTINRLIAEAAQAGLTVGLTSAGRDGEERDILTRCPKPRISVHPGMVVATAAGTLAAAEASWDDPVDTGLRTPLGNVLLLRVREPGIMEVAGPSVVGQLEAVTREMRRRGAELVLVDGAFGRLATACPGLADGLILATGAGYSPDVERVVTATAARVAQITLRAPPTAWRRVAQAVVSARRAGLYDPQGGGTRLLGSSTGLGQAAMVAAGAEPGRVLILGGAVTGSLLEALMERWGDLFALPVVAAHAAAILVEPATWQRFVRAGGRLYVLEPANLLAVTVNPWSPEGPSFCAEEFLHRVWERVRPCPVFDPVALRFLGEVV